MNVSLKPAAVPKMPPNRQGRTQGAAAKARTPMKKLLEPVQISIRAIPARGRPYPRRCCSSGVLVGILIALGISSTAGQMDSLDAGRRAGKEAPKDEYVLKAATGDQSRSLSSAACAKSPALSGALLRQLPNRSQMERAARGHHQAGWCGCN